MGPEEKTPLLGPPPRPRSRLGVTRAPIPQEPEEKPPEKESFFPNPLGFAKNALEDAKEVLTGMAQGMMQIPGTIWKYGKEILSDPKGMALLSDHPDILWREIKDTGSKIVDAATENYRKYGVGVLYHKPVSTALDATAVASFLGGSLNIAGKMLRLPSMARAGIAVSEFPGKLMGRAFAKTVEGAARIPGISAIVGPNFSLAARKSTLRLFRETSASTVNRINADLSQVGAKVGALSDAEAVEFHKWRTLGASSAELEASPKVAEALGAYRRLTSEWEGFLKSKGLLTGETAEETLRAKYALERFGKITDEGMEAARAAIEGAEVKPVYGPNLFEKKKTFSMDDLMEDMARRPAVTKTGKVGFLEEFKGKRGYLTDPRTYIPRAIRAFREMEGKLEYVDRIFQDPKLALGAALKGEEGVAAAVGERIPTHGIFKKYFEDRARSQAVYVRDLVAKYGEEGAHQLLLSDAKVKADLAAVSDVIVHPTVKRILQYQFTRPGWPFAPFVRLHDAVLGLFKRTATIMNPRWYLGNIVGDAILSMVAGVTFGNIRRARKFLASMPEEVRATGRYVGFAGEETLFKPFMEKFERFGDFVQGVDQAVRVGLIDQALAAKMREMGSSFFSQAERMEDFYKATLTAPGELSRIQLESQRYMEEAARRVPRLAEREKEIARLEEKVAKATTELEGYATPEGAATPREKQIFKRLGEIKRREAEILSARESAPGTLRAAAGEIREMTREGVPGMAKKLGKAIRQEQRESTSFYQDILSEIRKSGGIRLTVKTERIPKSFLSPRGVPSDALSRNLFDRGVIGEASIDALADWLDEAVKAVKAPFPSQRKLASQARKIVRERSNADIRALILTSREQVRLLRELRAIRSQQKARAAEAGAIAEGRSAKVEALQEEVDESKASIGRYQAEVEAVKADLASDIAALAERRGRLPEVAARAEIMRSAVERANSFVGDYLGHGPIEQSLFRRLVPFYSWAKTMAMLAFKLPFLAPRAGFFWNKYAAVMATLVGDPEMPEWMAGYLPAGVLENGNTVWIRVASLSPFSGVQTGEIGGVPVPGLARFWEQNPILNLAWNVAGGQSTFRREALPYGEPMVTIHDGSVYRVTEDGKFEKVIPQTPVISGAVHMFPVVQLLENVFTPYEVRGHNWVGLPKPDLNPDGSYRYPREWWRGLVSAIGPKVIERNREEIIRKEQGRIREIIQQWKGAYRRSDPDTREFIRKILEDYARGELRKLKTR